MMDGKNDVLHTIDRALISEIWTSNEAYQSLVELCDRFGSRFGGTEGERQAARFLGEKMKGYGLENVHAEEFEYPGWIRGSARLGVIEPVHRELECLALPGCVSANVEAELLCLGHGTPGEFEYHADQINGRIVMTTNKSPAYVRRYMHRHEKYSRAVAAGAVGFIWMKDEGGYLVETGSLSFTEATSVPGVAVSKEVGETLVRLSRRGPVRVRLVTQNIMKKLLSWNVVGEIPGRERPEKVVVTGAHFDSHDISPGAMDDGAGTMVMLETARALAMHRQNIGKTLRFVCFGCEELGLWGSRRYVEQHQDELACMEFMLNLDTAGREGDKGLALQGCTELIGPLRGMIRDMKESVIVDNYVGLYSDMHSFAVAGVPSAMIFPMGQRPERGFGHTQADTLDKVSPRQLRTDAILIARLLLRLANLPDWPGRHRSKDELKRIYKADSLLAVLTMEGRNPFE